ncbi:MAG TPA: restriction endonuclease [Sphingobacterium sp.]|nr:restriction endonuclease [Sphingobacterium sp.]
MSSHFLTDSHIGIIGLIAIILVWFIFFRKQKFNRHRHNRKKSRKILAKIRTFSFDGQRIAYLRKIDPFVFEELLLDAFEDNGFTVQRNKRYTGDGGIDGIVCKNNVRYLIQAKRYKGYVNMKDVEDFALLAQRLQCVGFFCHTGKTGAKSKETTEKHMSVKIVSGNSLIRLLLEAGKGTTI